MAGPSTSSKKHLRSDDSEVFLVGKYAEKIVGAKLPSKRHALQVLFHHIRVDGMNLKGSARLVIDEILSFWEMARIPTKDALNSSKKLIKLYDELQNLQKNIKTPSKKQIQKKNDFKDCLDDLFDIAHADALEMITIEQDKQFLLKQREKGRPGSMAGIDQKLRQKEQRKMNRMEAEEHRKKKFQAEKARIGMPNSDDYMMECDIDIEQQPSLQETNAVTAPGPANESDDDCEEEGARALPTRTPRGKKAFINDRMLACMDKNNMSTPQAIHFISATADALGHDINELILNRSTVHRMRKEYRERQTNTIMDNFDVINF